MLDDNNVDLNKLQRQVKKEIFKPIFLSFPFLDRLGWLFPSRERSRQTIHAFAQELQRVVCAGREKDPYWMASEKLGSRLVAARESGVLTHRQFRDNLNVVFVAGQENPQLAMLSALYLLGKYPVSLVSYCCKSCDLGTELLQPWKIYILQTDKVEYRMFKQS